MGSYCISIARVAFSRERKTDNFLDCSNMICKNMPAQAFSEGLSVMYIISKVFWSSYKLLLEVPSLPLLYSAKQFSQCFEVARLVQDTQENQSTQTQQSFCVLDIIYRWVISASPFVFLFVSICLPLLFLCIKQRGQIFPQVTVDNLFYKLFAWLSGPAQR